MWLGILYGILIWQIIVFICVAIWDSDDKTIYISACIPFIIWWLIVKKIVLPLYIRYIKSHYNGYRFYHNKDCGLEVTYMTVKTASKFNQDETKEYYVKLVSEGKNWKSIPTKNEIYKKGIVRGMTKEYLNNFLK
jgi:hypothetical protein